MSKDKAMIKETGQIHQVESQYSVQYITMSFNFDLDDKQMEDIKEMTFIHDSEPKEEGDYYTLDNGKVYHEKNLIVGTDEIRDHKLKNII